MGRRRALLIGINHYHPLIGPLNGCVSDVHQLEYLLIDQCSFDANEVLILCDEEATRSNFLDGLKWLTKDATAPDVLLLYYSGHGTRLPNMCDPSGKDEALVAFSPCWDSLLANEYDASAIFLKENWNLQFIRDKELKTRFDTLPNGVQLTLLMDCCHSGDINRDSNTRPRFVEPPPSIQSAIQKSIQEYWSRQAENAPKLSMEEFKFSRESLVKIFTGNRYNYVNTSEKSILLAACLETQTALEKRFGDQIGGVLTHHFIDTMGIGNGITYEQLIKELGNKMLLDSQMPRLACPEHYQHETVFMASS